LIEEPKLTSEEVEQNVRYNIASKSAQKQEIDRIA
jgi:hypothetical protein